jgi:TonB family protein
MSSMQPTYKVMPVYPEIAKAAHVQGPVLLRVTISRSGDIENLSAINGSTMLWSSAIDTVRQWKYKPYLLNGEPQEVETVVLVNFHLAPDGTTKVDLVPDPIRVSAGVISSLSIYKVNPVYPPDAKAAGIQGAVVLRAMLGKDGSVEALQVVSGPPALTPSALDAVKQWTYKPYMLNGQPVEVETTITVNYTLADPSTPQGQGTPNGSSSVASDYNGLPLKKIGGPVSTPMVIYQVEPQFSQEARQAKFMGVVLLNLIVDQNGLPQNVHVLRGVGMGLDMKAIEAVKQYRFKPAMENGKPVAVALNIEVNFQIFDKPPVLPAATAAANSFTGTAGTTGNPTPTTTNPDLVLKKIGGGVSTPIVIHSVSPEYTPEARKAKIEGIVLVNLIVDQRGLPQNVYVVRGIDVGLDEKAVEAVRQYRFKPAMEDGKPVRAELNVEVNFKFF